MKVSTNGSSEAEKVDVCSPRPEDGEALTGVVTGKQNDRFEPKLTVFSMVF